MRQSNLQREAISLLALALRTSPQPAVLGSACVDALSARDEKNLEPLFQVLPHAPPQIQEQVWTAICKDHDSLNLRDDAHKIAFLLSGANCVSGLEESMRSWCSPSRLEDWRDQCDAPEVSGPLAAVIRGLLDQSSVAVGHLKRKRVELVDVENLVREYFPLIQDTAKMAENHIMPLVEGYVETEVKMTPQVVDGLRLWLKEKDRNRPQGLVSAWLDMVKNYTTAGFEHKHWQVLVTLLDHDHEATLSGPNGGRGKIRMAALPWLKSKDRKKRVTAGYVSLCRFSVVRR